jgi:hypothetical protein
MESDEERRWRSEEERIQLESQQLRFVSAPLTCVVLH